MASKRDDPAIVSQLKEQHTTVSDAYIFIICLLVEKTKSINKVFFPLPDKVFFNMVHT